jgi:tRNA(fMet)-specific endonuclease VapC
MTLGFLLDTNIVSEPLRPAPNARLLKRLRQHQAEVAIASVVWHELWYGCRRLPASARRSAIEAYLDEVVAATIPILPYDGRAAEWHAAERARLAALGQIPAFADGQIAAVAVVNGLSLITLNDSHFRVFEGLSLAAWAR